MAYSQATAHLSKGERIRRVIGDSLVVIATIAVMVFIVVSLVYRLRQQL